MMASTTNSSNDGSGSRKRPATDVDDSSDAVIGLDVGGKIFYTNRSTLTNGSSYFAARFGGSFGAENCYTDEKGREVYFIDGCPDLFQYILNFLRRGIPTWHKNLYKEDPVLHKRLIGEAEYFCIDSMLSSLQSRPIIFEPDGSGKDILYWLGTSGGKEEYKNPLDIGAISLGGTCFEKIENERERDPELYEGRKIFTQHRPLCREGAFGLGLNEVEFQRFNLSGWYEKNCNLLSCDNSFDEDYLDITFETKAVRPTHYSLRYEDCFGMTCWNFEASIDGRHWICLHKARGDQSIASPSEEKLDQLTRDLKDKCLGISDSSTRQEIATSIAEKGLRHVWEVKVTDTFYRHFRLKGAGEDCDVGCMHGLGFELYGEVEEV